MRQIRESKVERADEAEGRMRRKREMLERPGRSPNSKPPVGGTSPGLATARAGNVYVPR